MSLLTLEVGFLQPHSNLGVAPEPYYVHEVGGVIIFQMPVPGLTDKNISVKVINNRKLVIRSTISTRFTPKFRYVFLMPSDVDKEDVMATIDNGVLSVRLFKNKR